MTGYYVFASLVAVIVGILSILLFIGWPNTTKSEDLAKSFEIREKLRPREKQQQAIVSVLKESDFPSDWFTSSEIFSLETRAIFCKSWIFLAHSSRFSKPGDYHSFAFSNYAVFLIMGKDHRIRAFHNVCRHRAYTITKKESGSSTVLGCKYHGWSYNTRGQLVKAPMFEKVPGFRKEENSLFEIETRVSDGGAVWINLDTGVEDQNFNEMSDIDQFLGLKKGNSRWVEGRTVEGGFDWKKSVNSAIFNIGQPDISTSSILALFRNDPVETTALHVFPNSTVYKIPGTRLWYSVLLLPSSPNKTQIRYDIYSSSCKPEISIEKAIAKQIEQTISTQANILADSTNSQIPTDMEDKDAQHDILLRLEAHSRIEKTLGRQIVPVLNKSKTSQKYLQADILCKELDCLSQSARDSLKGKEVLAW